MGFHVHKSNGKLKVIQNCKGPASSRGQESFLISAEKLTDMRRSCRRMRRNIKAFITVFCSAVVMGFLLASSGLVVLYTTINVLKMCYADDWEGLFEFISGYSMGRSSMAPLGRVGGCMYTKAADMGVDLLAKVETYIPENDPRNPAVMADNAGHNVGDIAESLKWDQISFNHMQNLPVLSLLHLFHHLHSFDVCRYSDLQIRWSLFFYVAINVSADLIIGSVTAYYSNNVYRFLQD